MTCLLETEVGRARIEVKVPKELVWWTSIALASRHPDVADDFRFVSKPSGTATTLIIDFKSLSAICTEVPPITRLVALLWNGYESCLELRAGFPGDLEKFNGLETMIVGDVAAGDACKRCSIPCSRLFPQDMEQYRWSRTLSRIRQYSTSFPPINRFLLLHRPLVISGKVLVQLFVQRRLTEYARTRFVFCGQSGWTTLTRYARHYGLSCRTHGLNNDGLGATDAFLLGWLEALRCRDRDWTWRVVGRALLRLIAIRTIHRSCGKRLFLNLVPKSSLNAYQAGALFKKHVFLEFGGIHGDELVYPRTADLAIFGRQVLRFDTRASLEELSSIRSEDPLVLHRFLKSYEQQIVSTLETHPAAHCAGN